jgi:hypothetical protein
MSFVPYESLVRVEAEDIMLHLPTALHGLDALQALALRELIADGYARGLEAGFALSDFSGLDPATAMEVYSAGVSEGRRGE